MILQRTGFTVCWIWIWKARTTYRTGTGTVGRAMVDVTVFCPYYVAQFSCCTSRTVTKAPSWATTGLKPVHCSYTGSEKCPRAEGQTGIRIDDVLDEE
jgi:hypothetical protein